MHVIVTGGAGFIGSTICSALLDNGYVPIIVDSLVVGSETFTKERIFYRADIAEPGLMQRIKADYPRVDTVIHCAARIVVEESMTNPILYYNENVAKSLKLFEGCVESGIKNIIFSSSASVYGTSTQIAVDEQSPCAPTSPYASTKYMMEVMLSDICHAHRLKGISLRYFNPIGADPELRSGIYKENPSHLLGKLITMLKSAQAFTINGIDWDTRDGTPIRDYIHVWDLAMAHVKAVKYIQSPKKEESINLILNIGTGQGTTVREFVDAFQKVVGSRLDVRNGMRREGDIAGAYALTAKACELLGWRAERGIEEGIRDALEWEKKLDGFIKRAASQV